MFLTIQVTASELYIINMLQVFGFIVRNISTVGAKTNRDFAKILLGDFRSETTKTMRIQNIYSPKSPNIIFIIDYSHVIKKIRNNILKSKSSTNGTQRLYLADVTYYGVIL